MNVSPDALRKETVQLLGQIHRQIDEVVDLASQRETSPHKMTDQNGHYLLSPLLLAKAQCLQTLTMLNEQGKRR